ncbi:MAG: hypothetical protein E7164_01005 [Firmicutes bacterium]|nr:hypothetical protein [Bacillota bacterium]
MKKFIIVLVCFLTLGIMNVHADELELPAVTDHEKVTIYVFRGNGCSFCRSALTYFNQNAGMYSDYFEVKAYEVWENSYNNELLNDVAEQMGDTLQGVPYIVIGNSYSENGFTSALGTEMIEAALQEYQNETYVDLVKEVAQSHGKSKSETLREACIKEEIIKEDRNSKYDTIIILGIFAVVLGGGAALVAFSRKK